jgi:hypothetical protein
MLLRVDFANLSPVSNDSFKKFVTWNGHVIWCLK